MEVKADELIDAIRWRLGILTDANTARYEEIWNKLKDPDDPATRAQADRIGRFLNELIERVVRYKLDLPVQGMTSGEVEQFKSLWAVLGPWLTEGPGKESPRLTGLLRKALEEPKQPPSAPARAAAAPSIRPAAVPLPPLPGRKAEPRPANSQWVYRPVPNQEPLAHTEYYTAARVTPEGYGLLGARVRGKKHKHEGTNCDDWFEIATAGDWTLIAVADGAGSYKYSRLGARYSCQRAIKVLSDGLSLFCLPERLTADGLISRDANDVFLDPEVAAAQSILHQAVREAASVIDKTPALLAKTLGQAVTPNDLSATLLLAVHTTLLVGGQRQSLVVACQIGDGVIATVGTDGAVTLLGQADSGAYSGETEFLTSRRLLDPANLPRRTFALVGAPLALLVMTDGVGDDYFPADPGMARLYADLVLNGILLADRDAGPVSAVDPANGPLDAEAEALTADGPVRVLLRSAALYGAAVGVAPEKLAARLDLLRGGARDTPLRTATTAAEERLRRWLDAYHVRGSFDDRTLVVLDRERC